MEMVRQAQADKSKLEALSDKVAKWLFYIALVVGITAFVIWVFAADLPTALDRMVTVLSLPVLMHLISHSVGCRTFDINCC